MNNPLVSVIMSTYNEQEEWVIKAIESILKQTIKDFEFIIILDNPKNEKIKTILTNYSKMDNRIKLILNKKNLGLTQSLNSALEVASGTYIARMDSDDICVENRFEKQLKYFEDHPDIDFLGTEVQFIDEYGKVIKDRSNVYSDNYNLKQLLRFINPFAHPTWMFKSSILSKLEKYRDIKYAEDYDFITRVVTNGYKVDNLMEKLLFYRLRKSGISISNRFKQSKSAFFVKKMYSQRLKGKSDESLLEKYNKFMQSNNGEDRYNLAKECKEKARTLGMMGIFLQIFAFFISLQSRRETIKRIQRIIYLKYMRNKLKNSN